MKEQQNIQQPVAWMVYNGWRKELPFLTEEAARDFVNAEQLHSDLSGSLAAYRVVPTFTAPPVPRDVLMAAMRDAVADLKAGAFLADCGTDIAFRAVDYETIADRYASQVQPDPVESGEWRTNDPSVSSEHIKEIAKVCGLIPSHTTQELVDRVVGFGHVLLRDKAVQEKFVEANAHLLHMRQQPASAQPVAVQDGYALVPVNPTDEMVEASGLS